MRRGLVLGLIAGVFMASFGVSFAAAAAPGPRLAVVRDGEPLPGEELISTDPSGEHWFTIKRTPNSSGAFENLAWSGDGTTVAFGGLASFPGQKVVAISDSGGAWYPLVGTRNGFNPVFAPDGRALAFVRFRLRPRPGQDAPRVSTSIWLADLSSGNSRRLTPWRDGVFFELGSFSPNGSGIVASRFRPDHAPEIVSVSVADGAPTKLLDSGREPTYSPDGATIAFVRWELLARSGRPPREIVGGDLYVAAADGSAVKRLTFNPSRREESPSWDPSGERLAYAQYPSKRTFLARAGIGSSIFEINRDGTCRHRLLFTYGLSYKSPAWQPGPGREAGRIAC